jgi:hypothetical protein
MYGATEATTNAVKSGANTLYPPGVIEPGSRRRRTAVRSGSRAAFRSVRRGDVYGYSRTVATFGFHDHSRQCGPVSIANASSSPRISRA